MQDLIESYVLGEATQFSPFGSSGGKWFQRRPKDSKVLKISDAEAAKIMKIKGASRRQEGTPLALWWVPPEYVKVREELFRIKNDTVKMAWSWDQGAMVKKGQNVVKVR